MAVSTFLFGIGVTEFSLLQVQYVLTGAIATAPIVISSLALSCGLILLKSRPLGRLTKIKETETYFDRIATSQYSHWVTALFILTLPFVGFLTLVANYKVSFWDLLVIAATIYFISATTGLLAYLTFKVFVSEHKPKSFTAPITGIMINDKANLSVAPPFRRLLVMFSSGLLLIYFLFSYLVTFAALIYPVLPAQFGGGAPTYCQFIFASEAIEVAKTLGIQVSDESKMSESLPVFFETDKTYVVWLREVNLQV